MGVRCPPGAPRLRTCHGAGTAVRHNRSVKRCTGCDQDKPLDRFFFKNGRSGRRHSRCKPCQQAYWREYYHGSPDLKKRQLARNRWYRRRNRAFIDEYLRHHRCVDCGISNPLLLEFDHVSGEKRAPISTLIRHAVPVEILLAEIAKCEVRCANCHRLRTALSWPRQTRSALTAVKDFQHPATHTDDAQIAR